MEGPLLAANKPQTKQKQQTTNKTMKKMKVLLTHTEEALGTSPRDTKVYSDWIGSKAPDAATLEEEIAQVGLAAVVESGGSVFRRDLQTGKPVWLDYMFRGFFKDTCSALGRVPNTKSSKIKAFKKVIDGLIFVKPRAIVLNLPPGGEFGICERPVRISGPTGERTALLRSETVPAGTTCEFTILLIDPTHEDLIIEWLDHGQLRGMGQWRNSGKGTFEYKITEPA